jgi:hypothetical protein
MGLLDKYIAKIAGPAPDMAAIMSPLLDPDDRFLASAMVLAEAFERGGGVGHGLNGLLNKAVNVALTAKAANDHVGGADGSIGQTLPRDNDMLHLVASGAGLSAWKWSGQPSETPAAFYRIAGENVVSVVDTGQQTQDRARIVRVSFVDDSFFDYRVLPNQDAFLTTCTQRWPGN